MGLMSLLMIHRAYAIYACILVIQIFDGRADQPEIVFADLKMTNLAAVEV